MTSPTEYSALETELHVLRSELEWLRAERIDKVAHQALADRYAESQVRFRTIFENSPFGQKIISSDLVIRQANPVVLEMLGCARPEDVVGHQIMEFAHPDHREDWRFFQERLWKHKLPRFTLETCLLRTDGTSLWCQVTSMRFLDGGEELGFTQLEDISERKALELSLKRLYDAQETILHLVTHDLKAPIGHIQLLADLLQGQLSEAQLAPNQKHGIWPSSAKPVPTPISCCGTYCCWARLMPTHSSCILPTWEPCWRNAWWLIA
jgi:two-component system sensor histidine kinase VicK